jgi:hypothetical protein
MPAMEQSNTADTRAPFTRSVFWRKTARLILAISVPLAVFGFAVGVRRAVLAAQFRQWGRPLPFTLESALHFRRIRLVIETGRLPIHDTWVEYPQGVYVQETYTVGDERLYALAARVFPKRVALQERVRWIEAGWFSAGAVLLGWWLVRRFGAVVGWPAALLYAVAPSAVVRSTGQELSHENTALPVFIAHLALNSLSMTASGWRRALLAAASAFALAWALCWWDLLQFYVGLWVVFWSVRVLRRSASPQEIGSWILHIGALILAGTANPYLRAHGFAVSPIMLWVYGVGLHAFVRAAVRRGWIRERWAAPGVVWTLTLLPLLAGIAVRTSFAQAYAHFAELLWAKVRYLNTKPLDPALLTFDQRILWVPGLNSATWRLTRALFPGMLWLSLVLVPFGACRSEFRSNPEIGQYLWLFGASLVTYAIFARFHVFVALFAVICIGWGLAGLMARFPRLKPAALVCVMAVAAMEAHGVLGRPERWGRTGVYYDELQELTEWLQTHVAPEPVLANFGVSGSILAYGGCPIVLHPKFESPQARRRVQEYAYIMFTGTERSLREWACRYGAEYLVYSMGEFASVGQEQQMRYMANALNPPDYAPARRFEFSPDACRYFRLVWGNRKYRVFDILTRGEERQSALYEREARMALERGDLQAAEYAATQALAIQPERAEAQRILKHAMVLREEGFQTQNGEP